MAEWVKLKHPISFRGRSTSALCVEGPIGAKMANELGEIESISPLPYPADPRIKTGEDECPSFCFTPEMCAGRHSCPRSYACSE